VRKTALNLLSPTRQETTVSLPASAVAPPDPPVPRTEAADCLHAFAGAWTWPAGVSAMLALVQTRLQAYRVSLAWRRGLGFSLVAWTDTAPLDEGVGVNDLEAACNEAAAWAHAASWPPSGLGLPTEATAMSAHARLFQAQGLTAVMSVPVRNQRGQVVGVLSCERIPLQGGGAAADPRDASTGFVAADLDWLEALAALVGPVMAMRHVLEQPWYARSWTWLEALGQRLGDPRERLLRWSVLAMFGIAAFVAGWPLPYTVAVPARLEPQVQTTVVAPSDATLLSADVHAGDLVQAGQKLGTLSMAPSLRNREALAEQLVRVDALVQEAQAGNDTQALGRWQDVRADVQQRLDALRDIGATQVVSAPFDGVVIRQADRALAGVRLQRGDPMWVVAPGLDWRVVLEADEAVVGRLQVGQRGSLRLGSVPDRPVQLLIQRQGVPASLAADAEARFDVDAQAMGGALTGLRPGMRGMAHIDMPPRPVLWRVVDRLKVWWLFVLWELW
jgi:hypothetical protein